MRILIADDDRVSRRLLEAGLLKAGHEVILAEDGEQAWQALQKDPTIPLAILDWNMPRFTGPEICQRARQIKTDQPPYLILLTSRDARQDIVSGLQAAKHQFCANCRGQNDEIDPERTSTRPDRSSAMLL